MQRIDGCVLRNRDYKHYDALRLNLKKIGISKCDIGRTEKYGEYKQQ